MSIEQLSFSTNAKLEKLIGRELITNNIIAVFELIKNSYDAFARSATIRFQNFNVNQDEFRVYRKKDVIVSNRNSKIIISDDGKGMSFWEVKNNWMEIGTTSKEGVIEQEAKDAEDRRVINGEKGIGRFGTDKLGAKLRLISIGAGGYERTTVEIDWNKFDDHTKKIQDFVFDCTVEQLDNAEKTGVILEISSLRDVWTNDDIHKLLKHLKKLISPFAQEQDKFSIILEFEDFSEKVVNDSFDFATTGIEASISKDGEVDYCLFSDLAHENKKIAMEPPSFGPVQLKILYMDRAAKYAFTRRTGTPTREYGNIKLFRDDFRVLPYGEKENDWLGIDNKHAQGAFRTFATRDIVGYVQISKEQNPLLRDATSRQGLNEDIIEFEDFKKFIWNIITLLQDFVFKKIKQDSEKQGKIIENRVKEIKTNITELEKEIPNWYTGISINETDKNLLVKRTNEKLKSIQQNVSVVEQANKQLTNRVKVMEKIVGSESRLYDMLHAIKNRLAALDSVIEDLDYVSTQCNIEYDAQFAKKIVEDIGNMVMTAMRRSSPKRKKRDTVILSEVVNEFITESRRIYTDIEFQFIQNDYTRVFINVEELKISLENLLDNSMKAMSNSDEKIIHISIVKDDKSLKLYFGDSGSGISEADAPFIFNVSFSKTNGTGIGLCSVLDFMREEGGDISLVKDEKSSGAIFELVFPIK